MAQRRALKDTVTDPMVKKETPVNRRENQKPAKRNAAVKVIFAVMLGFAGGLLTGRWLKI
jgi:hypothetical protein